MNRFILSSKIIPDIKKFHAKIKEEVSVFDGILREDNEYTIILTTPATQELIDQIESIFPPVAFTQQEQIQKIISDAISFGTQLISEFAAQNVIIGITQDNMTGVVRKNMREVIDALSTGSLYDAIYEARLISSDKKDLKYITDTRLLQFINKIETYLNIPLSSSL